MSLANKKYYFHWYDVREAFLKGKRGERKGLRNEKGSTTICNEIFIHCSL